jgi:hypothetical protein
MDDIESVIDQLFRERKQQGERLASHEAMQARQAIITRLFRQYRERDVELARDYIDATNEIPLTFLAAAVIAIGRSRVYSTLPQTGEIWTIARKVARMHRGQYRNGHYGEPPKDWPPEGMRHSIHAGQYEPLPGVDAVAAITAGKRPALVEET